MTATPTSRPDRRMSSTILSTVARGLTPIVVLVSLVVTFRGHNAPGGGFAGALVMSLVVVLRFLADGEPGIRTVRFDPVVLAGLGLCLAVATAAAPLAFGQSALDAAIWKFTVPLVGEIKFVTSAVFDIGVYLLVIGGVTAMLTALAQGDGSEGTS